MYSNGIENKVFYYETSKIISSPNLVVYKLSI